MCLLPGSSGYQLSSRAPGAASTRIQATALGPDLARESATYHFSASSQPQDPRRRKAISYAAAEYVFFQSTTVAAARVGVWLDPDHQPYHTADSTFLEQALLPPGDDVIHYAMGFGLAFESFQLDVAADFSDLVDTASLSAIYSF